jgi:uncharacterized protein (DUF58 family)
VTRRISPRLHVYASLAALELLGAIALGQPELVALAVPFVLMLVAGLVLAHEPCITVIPSIDRERVLQGDEVEFTVRLESSTPVGLETRLALPPGLNTDRAENPVALHLKSNVPRVLSFRIQCTQWGAYVPGPVHVRAVGPFGLLFFETMHDCHFSLRVYPKPEQLERLLPPRETQVLLGNYVSREKSEGIEFADLRAFVPGDRVRRVNWRASARRRELMINEEHPERNTDVILFIDGFAYQVGPTEAGTLDLAVRATAALAEQYLNRKDRVGLVTFGGVVSWLQPASGITQLYRIIDSVLTTEIVRNLAWKDIDVIPARTLPPKALVIALSPLLDRRSVYALLDLRARGFDLVIVEVEPNVPPDAGLDGERELAQRLWQLRRGVLRSQFEQLGVPVARWRQGAPLAYAFEEVARFRQYRRRALA